MKHLAALFLPCCVVPATAQVRFDAHADYVAVNIEGKPFTTFYFAGAAPKPYLHPLTTAGGNRITRLYPMENVAGETHDHPHHRGLWFTHGDVNGLDFWANEVAVHNPKRGIIVNSKVLSVKNGDSQGVIESSCDWAGPGEVKLLAEHRTMTFYSSPDSRVIDFDVTFTAATKVTFGDTKEGFFAIRLRDELSELKGSGMMVNAEGKKGMGDVWGARSPWVDYSGDLEGKKIGVAIFDHPENPKHPTFWHARDYGLFAANAFGEHDFLKDKTKDGSLTLQPGRSLRFRYRVLIHNGDTEAAGIAKEYAKYAK